jgi:hypothetical protein
MAFSIKISSRDTFLREGDGISAHFEKKEELFWIILTPQ